MTACRAAFASAKSDVDDPPAEDNEAMWRELRAAVISFSCSRMSSMPEVVLAFVDDVMDRTTVVAKAVMAMLIFMMYIICGWTFFGGVEYCKLRDALFSLVSLSNGPRWVDCVFNAW